jgi:hypothetical protein
MTLEEVIARLDELSAEATIYAQSPARVQGGRRHSQTRSSALTDYAGTTPGFRWSSAS